MGSPPAAAVPVLDDLKAIFGPRLEAFVTYAPSVSPAPSLALVTSLDLTDLAACATRVRRWQAGGAATPVVLTRREFTRSLDVFPVEFGDIIAHHETLHGDDPFAGLSVAPLDLRRACEGQIRSLLLHIREDYMEAAGASRAVAAVVIDSAAEFRALLKLVARLDGQPGDEQRNWRRGRPSGSVSTAASSPTSSISPQTLPRAVSTPDGFFRTTWRPPSAGPPHRRMARPVVTTARQCRRQRRTALAVAVAAVFAIAVAASAQPLPPALTAPVNDFAGVIDPASAQSLETPDSRTPGGQWRRRRRRHGEDVPAVG